MSDLNYADAQLTVASDAEARAADGDFFHSTTNTFNTATTSETPIYLFKNPSGSGVSAIIRDLALSGAAGNDVIYRIYIDPTVTANGTALTITGARQTGQTATACNAYKSPTTSANGTLIWALNIPAASSSLIISLEAALWIEANHMLLITATQSFQIGGLSGVSVRHMEQ